MNESHDFGQGASSDAERLQRCVEFLLETAEKIKNGEIVHHIAVFTSFVHGEEGEEVASDNRVVFGCPDCLPKQLVQVAIEMRIHAVKAEQRSASADEITQAALERMKKGSL